ncbi:hypothetical protein AU255_12590 [Methyloprofundus sedimenti]|uniref:Uncharacterized protein n=1 Tax=Methyloprofundus sedimenti TaxID=1420851 RepID=A0A1V8MAI4_9GAMM|nr:hypothetical protein [Methyloprofundus sedimenti]OQK18610.1 hypothetical protein AU255_12590 [Methyloprofundus sedimenti]
MALFISAFLPDRQLDETPFYQALTKVAIDLAQYRKHPVQTSKPNLDLYFLMSGAGEKPEFEGMRFHSFDIKSNTLKIESSVPRNILQSVHAKRYVVAVMQDAVEGAQVFFEEQNIDFQHDQYHYLIETLSADASAAIH